MLAWVTIATGCVAVDGDTLRCGKERVRLLGIDAPEMPGHCRRGRECVPGDPFASRDALAAMLDRRLKMRRLGRDFYGRTLAIVEARGRDLSCHQVRAGLAIYKARYDRKGLVARRCEEGQ